MGSDWVTSEPRRTAGEWVFIALIASLAVGLVVSPVWYVVWVVRPVVNDFANIFSCSESEWAVANQMADDPAVLALADRFSEGKKPVRTCDPDDGTAATDFVFRSKLAELETIVAAKSAMESHGWATNGRRYCFTKGSDDKKLWAYFTVGPTDGGGSRLGLSIVNADYCALSNVPNQT